MYLEHNSFQTENHGKVTANVLDKNIKGTTPYPAPKSTISTWGDWCQILWFACSGRTKEDSDKGIDFGTCVASNQLAFSPSALLMHSTNLHFRFYHLE